MRERALSFLHYFFHFSTFLFVFILVHSVGCIRSHTYQMYDAVRLLSSAARVKCCWHEKEMLLARHSDNDQHNHSNAVLLFKFKNAIFFGQYSIASARHIACVNQLFDCHHYMWYRTQPQLWLIGTHQLMSSMSLAAANAILLRIYSFGRVSVPVHYAILQLYKLSSSDTCAVLSSCNISEFSCQWHGAPAPVSVSLLLSPSPEWVSHPMLRHCKQRRARVFVSS